MSSYGTRPTSEQANAPSSLPQCTHIHSPGYEYQNADAYNNNGGAGGYGGGGGFLAGGGGNDYGAMGGGPQSNMLSPGGGKVRGPRLPACVQACSV